MKSWSLFKQKEYDDMVLYKVHCDCLGDDHIQTLMLEYDHDMETIAMTIYGEITAGAYQMNWFTNLCKRIWLATKILFTGHLSAEGSVLITRSENIIEMYEGLYKGLRKIQTFEENLKRKRNEIN